MIPRALPHDPILKLERDVNGGLLYGQFSPWLRFGDHFPHDRQRLIAICCDILRQRGYLHRPGPDVLSTTEAAAVNASFVIDYLAHSKLWRSLGSLQHEVYVETLDGVTQTTLAYFHENVGKLIELVEQREQILSLRRQAEILEAQYELREVAL